MVHYLLNQKLVVINKEIGKFINSSKYRQQQEEFNEVRTLLKALSAMLYGLTVCTQISASKIYERSKEIVRLVKHLQDMDNSLVDKVLFRVTQIKSILIYKINMIDMEYLLNENCKGQKQGGIERQQQSPKRVQHQSPPKNSRRRNQKSPPSNDIHQT